MSHEAEGSAPESSTVTGYESPRVEEVLTAAELDQEIMLGVAVASLLDEE